MIDKLFTLLMEQPLVSICILGVLVGFLGWVFRTVISDYIRKKFDLYTIPEIKTAVERAKGEVKFYSEEQEVPPMEERVETLLKNK